MLTNKPRFAIILTGLVGRGKTTGATHLKKSGWDVISVGDIIREMCHQEGLPTSRKSLQKFGARLLQEKGYEYFVDIILSRCQSSDRVVFEGIRSVQVVNLIKRAMPKVLIIFIEAKANYRNKRLQISNDPDNHDFNEIENPFEREVLKIKPIADAVINNDTDLNYFYGEIDRIASSFIRS